jgi:3-oxoacyl-[acyl-carrier protein] reductase
MKRTAIITGASRGIGRAVAINLATKGFSLVLVYKSSHDKIKELEKENKSLRRTVKILDGEGYF